MKSALIKRTDDTSSAPSVANELNFEPRRPLCSSGIVHNSSVRSQRDPLASRMLRLRVFDRSEVRASNSRGAVTVAMDRGPLEHVTITVASEGSAPLPQLSSVFFKTQIIPLTVCCTPTSGHSKSTICESQTALLAPAIYLSQRQSAV